MGKNIKYPNIYIGDIVLFDDDNLKRIKWAQGIFVDLFPGKGRNFRGEFIRPLQHLDPLELEMSLIKEVILENVDKWFPYRQFLALCIWILKTILHVFETILKNHSLLKNNNIVFEDVWKNLSYPCFF